MRPLGSLNKNARSDYLENSQRIMKAISGISGAMITARQIQSLVPLSVTVINKHLRRLEAEGLLKREGTRGDSRGYILILPQSL